MATESSLPEESSASCSTSATTLEKAEVMKNAADLLAQGKRNMVCGEIPKAVSLFEEAVQLLVGECGELSRDCADAYFSCGSALLELGRMETNVLGAALEGVEVEEEKEEEASEQFEKPPADEGEERQKLREEVYEAMAEGEREEEYKKALVKKKCQEQDEDGEEADAEGEKGEDQEDDGEDKEEDVPNFQLAWEYLDLAKVIYLKSESKDDQLKAAECHIKLGELSMETEQYPTAAEDLENALKIQQKHLSADDRLIAETHYQLGLAYGLGKEFELSIQHYQSAVSVIETKIASLNKLVEEKEVDAENKENRETDELQKYKDEIKELNDLLPEMKDKIEDTRVEAKEMEKMKQMAKEMLGLSGTSKGFSSPTKRVEANAAGRSDVDENGEKKPSDIAHLVRKKRKPEEDPSSAVEVKKIRQEENGAGDATVNGTVDSEVEANDKPVSTEETTCDSTKKAIEDPTAVEAMST